MQELTTALTPDQQEAISGALTVLTKEYAYKPAEAAQLVKDLRPQIEHGEE